MIKINVVLNNRLWKRYIKRPKSLINDQVRKLNNKNKLYKKKLLTCTILLSDNKEIKYLNKKFRNKNKTTDVLSFPFYKKKDLKNKFKKEKEVYLGDIIVNLNKIKTTNKKNFSDDFLKIWIHGLVHLLGYDHKKDKDYYRMQRVETDFYNYIK